MTIRYRIVFSLTLTVVFAVPRTAGAQFDLDRQATEIATQVQEILNRITQYTTLLDQYTSLDCSAQGMAAGVQATPVDEAAVVCDTLGMLGSFRDSYQQLLAAPSNLLHTAPPLPDWRDVLQAADTVTEADIRNIYQDGADDAVGAFQRQREYADRGLVLAHAESDAVAALTDTLDEADAAVRGPGSPVERHPHGHGANRSRRDAHPRAACRCGGTGSRPPGIRPGGGCLYRRNRAPGT